MILMTHKKEHWSKEQTATITEYFGKVTIRELAEMVGKGETAVKLFVHRHRIAVPEAVKRNLVKEVLRLKFTDPNYFSPTREFFVATCISQKRWWDLYYGRKQISEREYQRVTEHLGISSDVAFEARQFSLFDQDYK